MDTVSKKERSRIMALVKSKGNQSTELLFISILKSKRITGWRRNYNLIGKPDIVFQRRRVAIFLDGCFWHGCARHCRIPASNKIYWKNKILRNVNNDKKVTKELRAKGWKVIRIWEHDIKSARIKQKLKPIL